MAEPGSAIFKKLAAISSQPERDRLALSYIRAGNVPSWTWNWRPIRVKAMVDGRAHQLEYLVMPDYLALGTDDDFFWVPLLPATVQAIADMRGAVPMTTRMVDEAFGHADSRLVPQPVSPNTGSVQDWAKHSIMVQKQMQAAGIVPGMLVDGHKKTIVVGPDLDGSRVAIYGWHDESGKYTKGRINAPIQGYNPKDHDDKYTDYSHGTRLAKANGYLNGTEISLREIATDPKLHVLLSSQGPFDLHFPNSGKFAQASTVSTTSDGGDLAATVSKMATEATSAWEKGDDIRAAQLTLRALGYNLGNSGPNKDGVDGVAGPVFRAALLKFQAKEAIMPTGTLDSATKDALKKRADELRKQKMISTAKKAGVVAAILAVIGGSVAWFRKKS